MSADHWAVLLVALKVALKVDSKAGQMVDRSVVMKVDLMVVAKVVNWESLKAEMTAGLMVLLTVEH